MKHTNEPIPGYHEVNLEDLNEETDAFSAYGFCRLKVQRGDEVRVVKVKIVSIPQEVLDSLRKKAPKPPAKMIVDPTTRQKVLAPDLSDPEFIERNEKHTLTLTREVVGRGVDVKLTLKDGKVAQTPDERYQALEDRGLSGPHFTELAQAILKLTDWTDEEREKFL